MDFLEFDSQLAKISADVRRKERELFGNKRNLPADESAIVFNFRLSHEEKLSRLAVIREAKAIRRAARKDVRKYQPAPKAIVRTFPGLITDADMFHARAFGIRL